ncbi:hypothetical protein ACP275_05G130100 [Erythranthe tilingii]
MKAKSSSSSSSSSFSSVDTTDVEKKLHELKNHPHLSASYIRSLVKQLTSSATTKQDPSEENGFLSARHQDPTRIITSTNSDEQPENPPPPQKRRPRRRRTQTTKPYQERMLNMAEARREIVTALKLHRKAREIKPARPEFHPPGQPESGFYSSYSWPVSYAGLALPGRALGLNLNLQDFDKTAVFQYSGANPPSTDHEPPSTLASAATPAAEVVGFGRNVELAPAALDFVESPFDEVMEFPGWMSADESVNDLILPDAYFQDRALPCMKIEEIGGIDDGDWLA